MLLGALPAQAATLSSPLGDSLSIPILIGRVIGVLLGISGSAALIMFVWGGFLWLTSSGKPDQVKKGRDTLIWAVIGLVVIFSAYVLVSFILSALTGETTETTS